MNLPDRPRAPRQQSARAAEIVAREAAVFIQREAGPGSLITVIRAQSAHMSRNGTSAGTPDRLNVFVSVYPVEKAHAALSFLERQREAFSDYLKQHTRLRLPRIDFILDNGEQSLPDTGTR